MGVPVIYNIRSLTERKATTFLTALGIGLTVAVLVIVMALSAGLESVFAASGDPRQAIVLRKGSDTELSSTVSSDNYQIVRSMTGIDRTTKGEPMVSPEGLRVINLPSVDSPNGMNVSVRGMLPIGFEMRKVEIRQGRMFDSSLREVIVGESTARRYAGAQIGKKLRFGRGEWLVVGIFRSGDSSANSEIWANLDQIRGDFESRGGSSSLLVRTTGATGVADLKKLIDNDQRLESQVLDEKEYYAKMTEAGQPLQVLGFAVAIIMAIGSAFAATNTMYAAVSRRSREIGTLRALGFGRFAILQSFILESITLSLLGGILGVLIALPVNGLTTGVGNFQTFSEVAFQLKVGPLPIAVGLLFAAIIGAVGGFLPAWAASRKGIVQAMRDI